jgi:uncharacterized protein
MKRLIAAVISGLLFGFGLSLSEMTNRQRILGFLDISGHCDTSLIFVMGGAVLVTLISFRFILKRSSPKFDESFHLPINKHLDGKLIGGSGLAGGLQVIVRDQSLQPCILLHSTLYYFYCFLYQART